MLRRAGRVRCGDRHVIAFGQQTRECPDVPAGDFNPRDFARLWVDRDDPHAECAGAAGNLGTDLP
jgi:hypothetical protein